MWRLEKRIETIRARLHRGESDDMGTLRMLQAQERMLLERAILEACCLQEQVDETKLKPGQKLKMTGLSVTHIMSLLHERTASFRTGRSDKSPTKAPNMYKHPRYEHEDKHTEQIVRERILSLSFRSSKSDCDAPREGGRLIIEDRCSCSRLPAPFGTARLRARPPPGGEGGPPPGRISEIAAPLRTTSRPPTPAPRQDAAARITNGGYDAQVHLTDARARRLRP